MSEERSNHGNNPIGGWKLIYGMPENGSEESQERYLNLFSGFRPPKKDQKLGEQNKNRLISIEERYFSWPEEAEQAARFASQESLKGREVYQCAHLLSAKRRIKENAILPKALYADGDGAKIPDWMPSPNVVIESSPGREHYYWNLTGPMTSGDFEELNRRVTYAIGADRGKWAITTLLRVPGTKNYKYVDTPTVEIVEIEDKAHDPKDINRALPRLKEDQKDSVKEDAQAQSEPLPDGSEEPPVRLNGYGMDVWLGKNLKLKEDGTVDTSASLFNIGRVLLDAGASRSTMVKALRERDGSLGWDKYTDRKSDKEYERIVDKLEESDRHRNTPTPAQVAEREDIFSIGQRVLLGVITRQGIRPPEELIEGILLKGKVHQLYAAPAFGKSWVALWLAKELINQGKRVLYLDTENGPRIIAERLKAMGVEEEKLDEYLVYYSSPDLPMTAEGIEAYVRLLEEVDPALVIFDSWVNFLSGAGLDENVSSDIAKWSLSFSRPARDRGITVLLLDHVPKEGATARGSGRKKEEMDVQWQLKNIKSFDRDTIGEIHLKREKDREGWLPMMVRFSVGGTEDGLVFDKLDGLEAIAKVSELKPNEKKICKVLNDTIGDKGATASEWEKACDEVEGVPRSSFYKAKKNLVEGEHYSVEGDRYYPQAPQEEEEAA